MKNFKKAGVISAKLIFVLIAAVGVIALLFTLARSERFETVQVNLTESQQYQQDQLRELGQLEEDYRIDGKLLLTQANLEKYSKEKNPSCTYTLNTAGAKETIIFKSKEKDIEFSLPYNEDWGSAEFIMFPYEELNDSVYFGPLLAMPNCLWQRAYLVELHETKPTAEILADLNMRNLSSDLEFTTVKDREAIKFVEFNSKYENCSSVRMYVLGVDYDYEFIVNCSEDLENDFAFLEQILLTVKLN